ncbi:hypothetical protein BLOT_011222 [Blomia tropicalis]|nr:hypothetical protein BLOT_011222 [Blomia tropicalis]
MGILGHTCLIESFVQQTSGQEMNTGLEELTEDSEEPYSKGLNEISISNTWFRHFETSKSGLKHVIDPYDPVQLLFAYYIQSIFIIEIIDGIRPTKASTYIAKPEIARNEKRFVYCQRVGINCHHITTHQSSPEETSSPIDLATYDDRSCRLLTLPSIQPRPTNVATEIELPTLRPIVAYY